jgi:hypothetical protein
VPRRRLAAGGVTEQLPGSGVVVSRGGRCLTVDPSWLPSTVGAVDSPQEHGSSSQRAAARHGGPGCPDAGHAFLTCPVLGQRPASSVHACEVHATGVQCPVWTSGRPVSVRFRVRIGDVGDSRPLENGSDAGMCSSTAMPWTAWPLTAARTTAKRLVKGPMSSRDYA